MLVLTRRFRQPGSEKVKGDDMSRKVTILHRLSLRGGAQKPSSNTSIEREGQMRKNLRVLDLKPTTCRHLLILCGLVVLLAGGPYSAEAGKNKQEAISLDVELDRGNLGVVVGENFTKGDTSLVQSPDGYFLDDNDTFVDPEEQCPCYGSAFAKDKVGGAYFGNRGMHLTPETPTYSMRGCGGLPADAGGV